MHRLALIALVSLLATFACTGSGTSSASASGGSSASVQTEAPRVSGAEARQLVGAGAMLLDVRTEEEFADGHIEGAHNMPVDRVRGELTKLPRDKPIVVYCAVGSRSLMAARLLKGAGYDVRNLGAMAAWNR